MLLVLVLFSLSSCAAVAPLFQAYSQIGVTENDRMVLLDENLKDFQEALYWGDPGAAIAMADASSHSSLRHQIKESKRSERIVESKIEMVEFSENAYRADVEVMVKYFKVPYYIVKERFEKQYWEFSTGSGWQFMSREPLKEG